MSDSFHPNVLEMCSEKQYCRDISDPDNLVDVVKICLKARDHAMVLEEISSDSYYSYHQSIIQWAIGRAKGKERDFPFETNFIGYYLAVLSNSYNLSEDDLDKKPFKLDARKINDDATRFKKLIQMVFYLRELREEGEPLSIELVLSDDEDETGAIALKKLAQIFGRGVAYSTDLFYKEIEKKIMGSVKAVYYDHRKTPQSTIYALKEPFSHITDNRISIVLRRDGLITIAESGNPLLEFYGGCWNIVDLSASIQVLELLIRNKFNDVSDAMATSKKLMHLAYHLASHNHGAILSVFDSSKDTYNVFMPKDDGEIDKEIKKHLKSFSKENNMEITKEDKDLFKGCGRLLLTAAIQDGGMVFDKDFNFLSSGRFVKNARRDASKGGSRKNASMKIGKKGIAIYISQDGNICLCFDDMMLKVR